MKKHLTTFILCLLLIFNTFVISYAEDNYDTNVGFIATNVYFDSTNENILVVKGVIYNAGSRTIKGINNFYLQVNDDYGYIDSAVFNDDNLKNLVLKAGQSIKWTFYIDTATKKRAIKNFKVMHDFSFYSTNEKANLPKGIKVFYNDKLITFPDMQPVIINGRTLIPARGLFEAMGCKVKWFGETQEVLITRGNDSAINLKIGSNIAKVGLNKVELDVPVQLMQSRTMIPLRFVAESLGATVIWGGQEQIIIVNE